MLMTDSEMKADDYEILLNMNELKNMYLDKVLQSDNEVLYSYYC